MKNTIIAFVLLVMNFVIHSQNNAIKKAELAEISRKLDNPLAKMWSLVFQGNLTINEIIRLQIAPVIKSPFLK